MLVCFFVWRKTYNSSHIHTTFVSAFAFEIFHRVPTSSRRHPKGARTLRRTDNCSFSLSLSQHTCESWWVLSIKGYSMINGLERHQWLVKRVRVACFYRLCGATNNDIALHTHALVMCACACVYLLAHATGKHHAILLAALKTYNDL